MKRTSFIPVIDLFAGPGGLSEGFSRAETRGGTVFRVSLSIEKDQVAHRTLELRAFFRAFKRAPQDYYSYIGGAISREELFHRWPTQAAAAQEEAWCATLGETKAEEIDGRIRRALKGETTWALIGGPPCQAYSLVGRARMMGADRRNKTNHYVSDHRHLLYREYLRILAVHRPPVFIMENVKGILSSKVDGQPIFDRILSDLRNPLGEEREQKPSSTYDIYSLCVPKPPFGMYRHSDYILYAENYGVPQRRHRVILLGIRRDLKTTPRRLQNCKEVSLQSAIGDLPRLRSRISKEEDSIDRWLEVLKSARKASWYATVDPDHRDAMEQAILFAEFSPFETNNSPLSGTYDMGRISLHRRWYSDSNLKGYPNHAARGHIREDILRYFFASSFARAYGRSPRIQDFPPELIPLHQNLRDVDNDEIIFADRFKVQLEDCPSTTVVSHISKDGHYFIHPDPSQCRSLTVREAARLQTFPDNYFFEGPRTEQYRQVGNAVPPFLASQIAAVVANVIRGAAEEKVSVLA